MNVRVPSALIVLVLLSACTQPVKPKPDATTTQQPAGFDSPLYGAEGDNLPPMALDFSWKGIPACSDKLPAFTVDKVPEGTDTLVFHLMNPANPQELYGGATINYKGKKTLRPSNRSYKGPCPTDAQAMPFKWMVLAIDELGEPLARGEKTLPFPDQGPG